MTNGTFGTQWQSLISTPPPNLGNLYKILVFDNFVIQVGASPPPKKILEMFPYLKVYFKETH